MTWHRDRLFKSLNPCSTIATMVKRTEKGPPGIFQAALAVIDDRIATIITGDSRNAVYITATCVPVVIVIQPALLTVVTISAATL